MSKLLHINPGVKQSTDENAEFKCQIKLGLSQPHKQIQSKFFYDKAGSLLFNQITRHPDYYLTQVEIDILQTFKGQMTAHLPAGAFNLVELGPGEGLKTEVLAQFFLENKLQFNYMPIDISSSFLSYLLKKWTKQLPTLNVFPIQADYFHGLEWLSKHSKRHNVILFLGSSIGNFHPPAMVSFLHHLEHSLNEGDLVLIGFDLRKDIDILLRAYNDSSGITRDFNLNLLKRINRELQANFDIKKFRHYPTYNVLTGAMESYLVSLEPQEVYIKSLNQTFYFDVVEPIHVEYSYKYLISQLDEVAEQTGFQVVEYFLDDKKYFVDALWRIKK